MKKTFVYQNGMIVFIWILLLLFVTISYLKKKQDRFSYVEVVTVAHSF